MQTSAGFACLLGALALAASAQEASRPTGWVVIPVAEYRALHGRAFPAAEPETPPPGAALTRVDYELHIDDAVASGQARLTVDVLADGWVRVPVPAGLLLGAAALDGKPLALVYAGPGKGGGQPYAVLSKKGRQTLTLEFALPVTTTAGEEHLALPPNSSGVTRAVLTLARGDLDVRVTGGLLAEKAGTGGAGRWVAFGRGSEPLVFAWRRRLEERRTSLPVRLRGSLTQLLALGEDTTSVQAQVALEVLQGAARQVRVQVPAALTVNGVMGATVADWRVEAGALTVTLLEPAEQGAGFILNAEARLPRDGAIEIPLLRLQEVERETGGVAVEVLGAGEIRGVRKEGLDAADPGELGTLVASRQSPSLAAWRPRLGAGVHKLSLDVVRYEQQAVLTANVEEARYRALLTAEGKTLVEARYAVRNSQRNFLRVGLPAGAVVWSAALAGRPVRPGQAPDGSLLFPLEKSRAGEEAGAFVLEVVFLARAAAWEERGRAHLALPALDLPVSRTGVVVHYPPAFRLTPEPGAFRTGEFTRPAAAALNLAPPGGSPEPSAAPAPAQQSNAQVLVDQFNARSAARATAARLPIRVAFPAVGPTLYLVSELTGEGQVPAIELGYQKDRKGGVR